ncbi:MAG TPA: hypothetical protein VFQ45_23480 [Longimicrobium sp.]|nr:hypothetical protein [Longimicrobium sp.]
MRYLRFAALLPLLAAAAACTDETPTLSGDDFPPGTELVTREVIVPASEFLNILGVFSGYTGSRDFRDLVVAENYDGLYAHAFSGFAGFPDKVTYRRAGATRNDSLFSYGPGRIVLRLDTLAASELPLRLQLWELGQRYDPRTTTWTTAIDTGAVETPWTVPGGTPGQLLSQGFYNGAVAEGDSLVFDIDAEAVGRLADTASLGVMITGLTEGTRVQIRELVLRTTALPDSADPDTAITVNASSTRKAFVFTPDQPSPGPGVLAIGGIRSARTLFELDLEQLVCADPLELPTPCDPVPLGEVRLNRVSLLLRPVDTPGGYDPIAPLAVTARAVSEPELGRYAPLGNFIVDSDTASGPYRILQPGDTLLEIPITGFTDATTRVDSLPTAFALVSEFGGIGVPTFGVGFFEAGARLRLVYTVPVRRRLP